MNKDVIFPYEIGPCKKALQFEDYFLWDCSVIKVDNKYHMFCSRWPKELTFGWHWLFNSMIVHCESDKPEGPFKYVNDILPRRGNKYFDGMDTHNPRIVRYKDKFYLYYMGCTYGVTPPDKNHYPSEQLALETWNRKRIGVAVSDKIEGPYKRFDKPILEPRDCSYWDCTITTNPSVVILDDGTTYMIYKSRRSVNDPLQFGIAVAPSPTGPFKRLSNQPIFDYDCEDPFIYYDKSRETFCLIAKTNTSDPKTSVTGIAFSGFYCETKDFKTYQFPKNPLLYSLDVKWEDGSVTHQCNLERPCLIFDDNGNPTHLYCSSGDGNRPYFFETPTYNLVFPLKRKDK